MTVEWTSEAQALLRPYVTNLDGPVFALRNLPEEVVAVLFAYYSRSPNSLRHNLLTLLQDESLDVAWEGEGALEATQDKARAFHEKWVIRYGHASVAEHGVIHLAVEDISLLASKAIEDSRLASFTEKSTRYVRFEAGRFHRPDAIMRSGHAARYLRTMTQLFEGYHSLQAPLMEHLEALYPRPIEASPGAYRRALRAKAFDILRYVLPAGTLTNLGMTVNGRALSLLVAKLLTHTLPEVRALGGALKEEGRQILPTLLKYTDRIEYRALSRDGLEALYDQHFAELSPQPVPVVSMVRYTEGAEQALVAALLYPAARVPLTQLQEAVRAWPQSQIEAVFEQALAQRGPFDSPLRELEHVSYTFDLLIDFGAYRDLQRHRMVSQASQPLSIHHGYELPEELEDTPLGDRFEALMEEASACYLSLAGSYLHQAAYVVPMAFRRRLLMTMNLRELFHLVELRSAPQGHRSYRRVAQEIFRQVARIHPLVARYIRVVLEELSLGRLSAEDASSRQGNAPQVPLE